jgi:hypothetical protein
MRSREFLLTLIAPGLATTVFEEDPMRKLYNVGSKFAFATFMAAGASLFSFAPAAQADTFLTQFDDSTDSMVGDVFRNGAPFQHVIFGESITQPFGLFAGTLTAPVSVAFNFLEADGVTLSDTLSISGTQGSALLSLNIHSDVEGGPPLTALVGATSLVESASFLTVLGPITVSNGDTYTFQFRSDVDAVPLPAALPLFATGLGALGLLGWRRKRKVVA